MEQRLSENHNFDFDIGYLVKSPCRDCITRETLPDCIQGCQILDQIQTVLADSIPRLDSAARWLVTNLFEVFLDTYAARNCLEIW